MEKKKTTAKSRNSTAKPNNSANKKKPPAKPKQAPIHKEKQKSEKMGSVILFFSAILIALIIFIPGEMLWLWCHNALRGMFSYWSIFWPVLMIFVAIVSSLDNHKKTISGRIWMVCATILLVNTTAHIWGGVVLPEGSDFFTAVEYLFNTGISGESAGVVGAALGIPLEFLLGDVGAKIVSILFLIVTIMFLTGSDLVRIYRMFAKPTIAVAKKIEEVKEKIEEKQTEKELLKTEVDYEDSEEYDYNAIFVSKPKQAIKKDNSKLDNLNQAFGIKKKQTNFKEENTLGEETQSIAEAFQDLEEVDLPQTSNEEDFDFNIGEEQKKPKEKATIDDFEEEIKNEVRSTAVKTAPSATATDIGSSDDILENVAKAAKEFMKKREEDEKRELATTAQMALYRDGLNAPDTYFFPPVSLLSMADKVNADLETQELQTIGQKLVDTLKSFGVETRIVDICRGPSVTRYELQPAPGVKISKITNLSDDIALNLAAVGVRIEAPIPGKAAVGIEIPNKNKTIVKMRELLESNQFIGSTSNLTVTLGRDIAGQVKVADLSKMPHMLIAGTTGSGKSICINSFIVSLIYKSSPEDVRFLMIDPKVVELGVYNGIPHLLVPVVTDPRKAAGALNWAVTEMLNRYKIFAEHNVKDLGGYNNYAKLNDYEDEDGQPLLKMPQIVIIIDELADLMMAAPSEVEDSICRLAQMARAAGMHLLVATQRPTVDVVTGLIKANIPSRIAFAVSSAIDSRTILDTQGAEKLLGQGDMLYSPVGNHKPTRIQGCYVKEEEIEAVVDFIKNNRIVEYDEKIIEDIERNAVQETNKPEKGENENMDPMMEDAIKCVVEVGQASTSLLQRRLRLGYARAGRLIDEMEQMGVVGPHEGSKPRQVLMGYNQWLERNMQKADGSEKHHEIENEKNTKIVEINNIIDNNDDNENNDEE